MGAGEEGRMERRGAIGSNMYSDRRKVRESAFMAANIVLGVFLKAIDLTGVGMGRNMLSDWRDRAYHIRLHHTAVQNTGECQAIFFDGLDRDAPAVREQRKGENAALGKGRNVRAGRLE
jgi:hypothetical protein